MVDHLLNLQGAKERLHLFKANLLEEGSFHYAVQNKPYVPMFKVSKEKAKSLGIEFTPEGDCGKLEGKEIYQILICYPLRNDETFFSSSFGFLFSCLWIGK